MINKVRIDTLLLLSELQFMGKLERLNLYDLELHKLGRLTLDELKDCKLKEETDKYLIYTIKDKGTIRQLKIDLINGDNGKIKDIC